MHYVNSYFYLYIKWKSDPIALGPSQRSHRKKPLGGCS